jgi:hypothetical protein
MNNQNPNGSFRIWLWHHWQTLVLSFLAAALSFPFYELVYASGLDGPFPWLFSYAADGHYELVKHLIFPHGPLAFLIYPVPLGNSVQVTTVVLLVINTILAFQLFELCNRSHAAHTAVNFLVCLVVLSLCEIQLSLLLVAFLALCRDENKPSRNNIYLAAAVSVLNLFIKSYGGNLSGLLLIGWSIRSFAKGNKGNVIRLAASYLVVFLLTRLALFGTLTGSADFFRGQWELALNNSEATAFYQEVNWKLITIGLLAYLSIATVARDQDARQVFFLSLLPLFGGWKHAMTRADNGHFTGFLVLMTIFCFFIWIVAHRNRAMLVLAGTVAVTVITLDMAFTSRNNDYETDKRIALFRPYNLTRLIFQPDSLFAEKKQLSGLRVQDDLLPDSVRKFIGNNTTDIYPWNYGIVAANNLNLKPRPVICSYAAYTSWLDKTDALHFAGDPAEYLIWDLDELGGGFVGIDYRYLLNDEPQTIMELIRRYELIYKDSKWLVMRLRTKPLQVKTRPLSASLLKPFGKWIKIPVHNEKSILRARVQIRKSFSGVLKSAFYKGGPFTIEYVKADSTVKAHKIIPANAKDGLWIDPLIIIPQENLREPAVTRIMIGSLEPNTTEPEFTLMFEEFYFYRDTVIQDPQKVFFGKQPIR